MRESFQPPPSFATDWSITSRWRTYLLWLRLTSYSFNFHVHQVWLICFFISHMLPTEYIAATQIPPSPLSETSLHPSSQLQWQPFSFVINVCHDYGTGFYYHMPIWSPCRMCFNYSLYYSFLCITVLVPHLRSPTRLGLKRSPIHKKEPWLMIGQKWHLFKGHIKFAKTTLAT